jgi:hypothetical protein
VGGEGVRGSDFISSPTTITIHVSLPVKSQSNCVVIFFLIGSEIPEIMFSRCTRRDATGSRRACAADARCGMHRLSLGASGLGLRVLGAGLRVWGVGFGVEG